ncbi:MAG: dTDP-4-dehydrorhamnose 3,5-epimerase [Actinomycetota bacterium]|nr:dTDP-4-dehydrorhamnose 3,5-epimerase [Actinomycetota bacterium]
MNLTETGLDGCFVVTTELLTDERGFFARTFSRQEFEAHGLNPAISQVSVSYNVGARTLRGLHYQLVPHEEAKLVRCTKGRIFDVAVDLGHRRWISVELSEENRQALYIPEGFAHGFLTLEPHCEVIYQVSAPYVPDSAAGIRWDDPSLSIDWPSTPLCVSERDRSLPVLA